MPCGYRIDQLVEGHLILALEAVGAIREIHKARMLTYMKLSGANTGLMINFNVRRLADGIQRVAAAKGVPCQPLISGLLHQYVESDLVQKP